MIVLTDTTQEGVTLDASSDAAGGSTQTSSSDVTQAASSVASTSGVSVRRRGSVFVCRYCNKSFDRSYSVVRHERMHTGFKPCLCRFCGRGFSEPRNLRQHLARFHASARGFSVSNTSMTSRDERRRRKKRTKSHSDAAQPEDDDRTQDGDATEMTSRTPQNGSKRARCDDDDDAALTSMTSSHDMASEIREKERLGDDVTVVIPSDAPLMTSASAFEPPRSVTSENTSWSNVSEGDFEAVASASGVEIAAAPVRSLIGKLGSTLTMLRSYGMSYTVRL